MRQKNLFFVLTVVLFSSPAFAASRAEIDAKVSSALNAFYSEVPSGKTLAKRAKGVLVFPEVLKAGVGLGGEYGEGALLISGKTAGYFSTASVSVGFQLGAQIKTQVILFMEADALKSFRQSEGWQVGVDGSVAIAEFGVGDDINSDTLKQPVIGFVLSNKGLMYNLSLEGSKITPIKR